MKKLLLLKLGGGLITDKKTPLTVNHAALHRIAQTVATIFREYGDEYALILGNGAGSFGHYVAKKCVGEDGSYSRQAVCELHYSVASLNGIVVRALLDAGVPAFSVSPSSCFSCDDGKVEDNTIHSIETALSQNIAPVLYGDIIPDKKCVGTVFSTEDVFAVLVDVFKESYDDITVIYTGSEAGVLDTHGELISELRESDLLAHGESIGASSGIDVTGGMRHKVESALEMSKEVSRIFIVSGQDDSALRILRGENAGTRVTI
jgi:isopentenyl phosphate kinase